MPTWTLPAANALSASTYIKDTDDKLQATMDDLEDFVNSAGTYVGVGLSDNLVNLTTNQTIAGVKTFSSSPVVPDATTSGQAVNKDYVDTLGTLKVSSDITGITGADKITNMVSLTQAEYNAIVTKSASTLYVIVG